MKISWWKHWLSYINEVSIETVSSDLNPELNITLNNGKFQLSTKKAIYSYDESYNNFSHAFNKITLPKDQSEVLILGLGLGSIPLILQNSFKKTFYYTGVELDHAVISLFSKYTLPRLNSTIEIQEADALSYIMQNEKSYPLICMDVFQSDVIPKEFQSIEFLNSLRRSLTKNGRLMYNCLAYNKEDIRRTKEFLETTFLSVFPEGGYIKAHGNWILVNTTSSN